MVIVITLMGCSHGERPDRYPARLKYYKSVISDHPAADLL
jgi:hypothetical protein